MRELFVGAGDVFEHDGCSYTLFVDVEHHEVVDASIEAFEDPGDLFGGAEMDEPDVVEFHAPCRLRVATPVAREGPSVSISDVVEHRP